MRALISGSCACSYPAWVVCAQSFMIHNSTEGSEGMNSRPREFPLNKLWFSISPITNGDLPIFTLYFPLYTFSEAIFISNRKQHPPAARSRALQVPVFAQRHAPQDHPALTGGFFFVKKVDSNMEKRNNMDSTMERLGIYMNYRDLDIIMGFFSNSIWVFKVEKYGENSAWTSQD